MINKCLGNFSLLLIISYVCVCVCVCFTTFCWILPYIRMNILYVFLHAQVFLEKTV